MEELRKSKLEFTPLEFETKSRKAQVDYYKIRIYSVVV